MLLWDYEARSETDAIPALPPEPLLLPFGEAPSNSPFRSGDYATIWRAIEAGYVTQPGDCPPVRLIARYGVLVRCPGEVVLDRLALPRRERELGTDVARFGLAQIGGTPRDRSDSGFIASWIIGSEFVKIQTGLVVYFPTSFDLYQGPLPNASLLDGPPVEVMAGIEYAAKDRTTTIANEVYGKSIMNIIVRLPPVGTTLRLSRGQPLAWCFPVVRPGAIELVERAGHRG